LYQPCLQMLAAWLYRCKFNASLFASENSCWQGHMHCVLMSAFQLASNSNFEKVVRLTGGPPVRGHHGAEVPAVPQLAEPRNRALVLKV
jgi:hypothetical protein